MMPEGKERKIALADALRRDVMTMRLAPGEALDEARLSEQFGVSRTPLREVFRVLAGEGYLSIEAQRGARVAEMGHRTLRDFFLAAPMIYSAITRLAARNATPEGIEDLRRAQAAFRSALSKSDAAERSQANNHFHALIGTMADNVYLLPSFRRLLIDHARISVTFYHPADAAMAGRIATAGAQHDAMIEAIASGDEEAAAALAQAHWELSRHQIELFVTPRSLEAPLGAAMRTG